MDEPKKSGAIPLPRATARRFPWRWARRITQVALLALFVWLFRLTEYRGADELREPVNVFFRIDPLIAAAAQLAGKSLIASLWPALLVVGLTILLGRFFCGWICPLGTLLDIFHRLTSPARRALYWLSRGQLGQASYPALRPVRHILLILVLIFAAMGLPLVGYLDPFALLTRAMALWVDPAMHQGATSVLNIADGNTGWWASALGSAGEFSQRHLLPFSKQVFLWGGVAMAMLALVFALELLGRRFWCRYLCPLGSMVGLLAWFSPLRRTPEKICHKCANASDCGKQCRMGAFETDGKFAAEACNLCMDCQADCGNGIARFTFKRRAKRSAEAAVAVPAEAVRSGMSRRAVLTTLAVGVAVPAVVKAARLGGARVPDAALLRPPGAGAEKAFLDLCIRCGECLKVCPTNALQPSGWQAGMEGFFSPRLVPRTGYCEVNCTLCGQVCPTHAIPALLMAAKAKVVIGRAVFDRERCLPWAANEECICCEEHCPISDKAIHYDVVRATNAAGKEVVLQRPYVIADRCIGCGICENKCPLDGPAAIKVVRADSREAWQEEQLGRNLVHDPIDNTKSSSPY